MDIPRMLADMALELEQDESPDHILERVCHFACLLLRADDAGVMRVHSRHQVDTAAQTSARVSELHALQTALDEGPCLDAINGDATYLTDDAAVDPRWPRWGPAAAKTGVHSTMGVRLATRRRAYGSLNVFADRIGAFDVKNAEVAEVLAAHATAAFAVAERAEGLQTALESRTLIGQAQGILMEKFDIDADASFSFLRRISQHENQRLVDVAEAIVVQRDASARPRS